MRPLHLIVSDTTFGLRTSCLACAMLQIELVRFGLMRNGDAMLWILQRERNNGSRYAQRLEIPTSPANEIPIEVVEIILIVRLRL